MKNRVLLLTENYEIATELKNEIIADSTSFDCKQLNTKKFNIELDQYDLIILDLSLSEQENRENLLCLREITDQVIFVLLPDQSEIIHSYYLELGADGIISLPIRKVETKSFIKAVLRRIHAIERLNMNKEYVFGDCVYRPFENIIKTPHKESILTVKEGQLLDLLVQNKNSVVSRERIFRFLHPLESSASDNSINILITRIRKKMKENDCPDVIQTISGVGYRINIPNQ